MVTTSNTIKICRSLLHRHSTTSDWKGFIKAADRAKICIANTIFFYLVLSELCEIHVAVQRLQNLIGGANLPQKVLSVFVRALYIVSGDDPYITCDGISRNDFSVPLPDGFWWDDECITRYDFLQVNPTNFFPSDWLLARDCINGL